MESKIRATTASNTCVVVMIESVRVCAFATSGAKNGTMRTTKRIVAGSGNGGGSQRTATTRIGVAEASLPFRVILSIHDACVIHFVRQRATLPP